MLNGLNENRPLKNTKTMQNLLPLTTTETNQIQTCLGNAMAVKLRWTIKQRTFVQERY